MVEQQNDSLKALPDVALELVEWDWRDIEAHYLNLESQPLDAGTVDDWLAAWSHLKGLVGEAMERLYVARTLDTTDQSREDRYNSYLESIHTPAEEHEQVLRKMLLESGLEPEGFTIPVRNLRAEAQLFREVNLPLLVEEKKVASGYDKIIGAQSVEWEGETITLPRLIKELERPERSTREKAWRLAMDQYLADRPAISKVWESLFKLRSEIAANADQPDYRAYAWQDRLRLEYSPDDCLRFHDAIESVVVPAASRIM